MSQEKSFGWKPTKLKKANLIVKEFNNEVYLINERGELITVSAKGSLAFLALGAIGHEAWLKARDISKKNAET